MMALNVNWTAFIGIFIVAYFALAIQQLYYLLNPLAGIEIKGELVSPLWQEGQSYDIIAYLTTSSKFQDCDIQTLQQNQQIIFHQENLNHTANQSLLSLDVLLVASNASSFSSSSVSSLRSQGEAARSPISSDRPAPSPSSSHPLIASIPKKFFDLIQTNKSSIFINFLLLKRGDQFQSSSPPAADLLKTTITKNRLSQGDVLFGNVKLIKYDVIPKYFHHRYLLSDFGFVKLSEIAEKRRKLKKNTIISYWKPEVSVKLVSDFHDYPLTHVPAEVASNMILRTITSSGNKQENQRKRNKAAAGAVQKHYFKPSLFVDEIGLTSDKYIHLNDTVTELPIHISIGPMSTQRWHLISKIEESLQLQKQGLGIELSANDLDDFRRMISDTSITLLTVTFIASALHLLFEYLAFSSDIQFWKENKSLIGLSIRSLFTDLFSQVIIFFYLIENNTSLLITIPSFIAILIQIWKINRATGLKVVWKGTLPSIEFTRLSSHEEPKSMERENNDSNENTTSPSIVKVSDDSVSEGKENITSAINATTVTASLIDHGREELEERLTTASLEADRFATKYLSLLFAPIIVTYVLYTLFYQQYSSWYSWVISSLTSCVYTFGFILMCPQLYINHQLKSVSYLPWQYLIYKFLNTFVDDLFAFIIKMPTMHRLSVFRDDIIFFIYLYQRWIYRVDKNRPTEK